jgi:ribosome-associated toxin RatA of RatAB toxin-antitoxin module
MTFDHSILIDAEASALFRVSQDYSRRLEWDPFLRSASLVGGASEVAVGVRALCVDRMGTAMETEYVSYNPPRTVAIKMTRGPWFLESFAGSWRFEEVKPGQTRVSFCYNVGARPRWLSWLLNPILRKVFGRDTRRRLKALKKAAEKSDFLNDAAARSSNGAAR